MHLMSKKDTAPFVQAALGWLVVGCVACGLLSADTSAAASSILAMTLFWALCLFSLFALGKALEAIFGLADASSEKKGALIIQASTWGILKLVSLGFVIAILVKARQIPLTGLWLGMASFIVIPVVGGFFWSQKVLKNGS
jgi:hypothetical protein